jgi:hypothetical protein
VIEIFLISTLFSKEEEEKKRFLTQKQTYNPKKKEQ